MYEELLKTQQLKEKKKKKKNLPVICDLLTSVCFILHLQFLARTPKTFVTS